MGKRCLELRDGSSRRTEAAGGGAGRRGPLPTSSPRHLTQEVVAPGPDRPRGRGLAAAGLAFSLILAACSGDDGDQSDESDPGGATNAQEDDADGNGTAGSLSGAADEYAASGWATVHSEGNRKYVPVSPTESYTSAWQALEDASVLAAPTVGPEGNVYATTGQGPGHANLHAYSPEGDLLWETEPWEDASGFDSCAILQSPVIDADGDVYVSDCNQFWAFEPDGTVKWTADLPDAPDGAPWQDDERTVPFHPFVTPVLTPDGAVLGITVWNQVVVLDRETGEERAPVFQLPATEAPPANPSMTKPPTLFAGGYADEELLDPIWELFWGGTMPQANTPVISDETGRVFAVAASTEEGGVGALYGIDYTPGEGGEPGTIEVAFEAIVGQGSSSSPTLSPEEDLVYVTDEEGVFYAVSTEDGEVECSAEAGSNGGSATAGPDGRVYLLGDQGDGMNAFDANCEKAWDADLSDVAGELPADTPLGDPIWRVGGPPTITDDGLLAPVSIGYTVEVAGNTPFVAVAYRMVKVDPETGEPVSVLAPQSGESDGFTVLNLVNDTIVVDYGVVASSSLAPLAGTLNEQLPEEWHIPERPIGGIELFVPASGEGDQ